MFLDVNENKRSDRKSIDKSAVKFVENKSDKKIFSDIDKLNERVYKLNGFLRLSKDIKDMKKESLVKDNIQRKFNLKWQWLSTKYGSTGSLNSSTAFGPKKVKITVNCKNFGERNKNLRSSAEYLKMNDKFEAHDANASRLYRSVDDLWLDTDQATPNENKDPKKTQTTTLIEKNEFENSKKLNILKNTIERVKDAQAKFVEPKVTANSSTRDLSRFFPQKKGNVRNSQVLEKSKELKDINLSKYFLPSPVQKLKIFSSPGQSSQTVWNVLSKVPNESNQMPAGLRASKAIAEARLSEKINEIASESSLTGGDYIRLVANLNTSADDIDDIFEEVAAASFDAPIHSEKMNYQRIEDEIENSPHMKCTTALVPSSASHKLDSRCNGSSSSTTTTLHDPLILKLSDNLLTEISHLEKQLQFDKKFCGEKPAVDVDDNIIMAGTPPIENAKSYLLTKNDRQYKYCTRSDPLMDSIPSLNSIVEIPGNDCNNKEAIISQDNRLKLVLHSRDKNEKSSKPLPGSTIRLNIENNITGHMSARSLRKNLNDPTELLIERSHSIHNKKQEFMNEKLLGINPNPYVKGTSVRIYRECMDGKNQDNGALTVDGNNKQGASNIHIATQNKIENKMDSPSLNTVTPSTTNLNVFELFKRNSPNNKQMTDGKDGCIIS